jgi:hypothetical protein
MKKEAVVWWSSETTPERRCGGEVSPVRMTPLPVQRVLEGVRLVDLLAGLIEDDADHPPRAPGRDGPFLGLPGLAGAWCAGQLDEVFFIEVRSAPPTIHSEDRYAVDDLAGSESKRGEV